MESIYFVLTWACHRTCAHCYDERFHPYYGADLERQVETASRNVPLIIANLPERMSFVDLDAGMAERRGRIILAGGEVMLPAIRESILYPALRQIRAKYEHNGGVELIVQTTGDLLTPRLIGEMLEHGVEVISVSGIDAFHEGYEEEAVREAHKQKLTAWFQAEGLLEWVSAPERVPEQRYFHFFGATPGSWIGKLWPRGRAQANELSTATLTDNFCNAWSGGRNFLERRYKGSEVSIDPEGNVFPCCIKTRLPLKGSLLTTGLDDILDAHVGNPIYEAINAGKPERMGLTHGWSVERFLEKSRTVLPSGREYQNLCVGCDKFHEEVLSAPIQIVR
ncbi:MAG: radical SAM protein [Bryobacteraceae bacterium]|nr:radical SAM protein [Bryobacteraceae bacterium]